MEPGIGRSCYAHQLWANLVGHCGGGIVLSKSALSSGNYKVIITTSPQVISIVKL